MLAPIGKKRIQRKMVRWYDPGQLLHAAVQVAVTALIGTRADFRVLESLAADQDAFDYSSENEIWIDYVADLGDGWNSTYTIASLLGAESLEVASASGADGRFQTERGRILIMGGDEVYPTAGRQAYLERTVGPYECALRETDPPHPNLFAIPGNHDWYDGLVSFSRLFCQERWIGGWKTRQRRSYFAIELPHRWWLWGVDIQLESDIDLPQLEYFRKIAAEKMKEGDRLILAVAEPHWIYGNIYDPKLQNNLAFLEEKVIGKAKVKLQVLIAGDIHHYRRHEAADGSKIQLITSGGGGAFLHPTNGPRVDKIRVCPSPGVVCKLKAAFPGRKRSKRLLLHDLLFPFLNPQFGLLTGLLYLAIANTLRSPLQEHLSRLPFTVGNLFGALGYGLRSAVEAPSALALIVVVLAGFVLFTSTHKKVYGVIGGCVHALAHLLALLLIGWVVLRVSVHPTMALLGGSLGEKWAIGAGLFVGGYFAGALIMGWYLYISLRFFRRHANEAFSALRIPDYKNFVRLHIDRTGKLTIFPIGVEKVPRKWEPSESTSKSAPELIPANARKIDAFLIERVEVG